MKNLKLLLVSFIALSCTSEKPRLQLATLFSDHMVLQQSKENAIWGKANANSEVTIEASWGAKAEATSGPDGKWSTRLATPSAGGPFQLTVTRGDSAITISDVYAGEVWVGSGQSNMEMPLKGWPPKDTIDFSASEIATANFPAIRMFTVARNMSFAPLDSVTGAWEVATPENAGDFSATAWYFAKKLHQELGIPVGIIHTSWGGTPAQAWTSAAHLDKVPTYEGTTQKMEGYKTYYDSVKAEYDKLEQFPIDFGSTKPFEKLTFDDQGFEASDFDDSAWKTLNVPGNWENQWMGNFDGVVWMRKTFELTAPQAASQATSSELFLGSVDDMDITYLNDTRIGAIEESGKWQDPRTYAIPAGLLKEGTNVVAVKVFDTAGGGGIFGFDEIGIRQTGAKAFTVPLQGEWKAKPVAESLFPGSVVKIAREVLIPSKKPEIPLSPYSPTTLYNAMIHPILPYGIRGAIWYQGESNVGAAEVYRTLFPAMIQNWRDVWGLGNFPFYYVQIAPFNYGRNDDLTAQLRDAQTSTLSLENTGMAVTIDIGNATNIHPSNKKDVGERLALWALAKDYGATVEYSGPMFEKMEVQGNKVVVSFTHDKGLSFRETPGFVEVAGEDGIFADAKVTLEGNKLVAFSSKVSKPVAVRYGWCEACEPNLFNDSGLPALPFNTKSR